MHNQHMTIFRATHVVELVHEGRGITVALRLVSKASDGIQVYRDVYCHEFVVDPSFGCASWPTHAAVYELTSEDVPLSWLRSGKPPSGFASGFAYA